MWVEKVPIEDHTVDGLVGLLGKALEISRKFPEENFLWFRGISDGAYQLLPKLLRDGKSIDQVFDREQRLLSRFRQRSLAYWPEGYPQNDWEHLFAMQHFGLPTRLLDWSENIFVAAHFALASSQSNDGEFKRQPVVWCIDPVQWNRSMPVLSEFGDSVHVLTTPSDESDAYRPITVKRRNRSPVAIFGTHNSRRIVAQRGTFMIWGNDARALEAFAKESAGALWRLEIAGDRQQLAKDLTAMGFGETMVFPELPSLANELARTIGWRP